MMVSEKIVSVRCFLYNKECILYYWLVKIFSEEKTSKLEANELQLHKLNVA